MHLLSLLAGVEVRVLALALLGCLGFDRAVRIVRRGRTLPSVAAAMLILAGTFVLVGVQGVEAVRILGLRQLNRWLLSDPSGPNISPADAVKLDNAFSGIAQLISEWMVVVAIIASMVALALGTVMIVRSGVFARLVIIPLRDGRQRRASRLLFGSLDAPRSGGVPRATQQLEQLDK